MVALSWRFVVASRTLREFAHVFTHIVTLRCFARMQSCVGRYVGRGNFLRQHRVIVQMTHIPPADGTSCWGGN